MSKETELHKMIAQLGLTVSAEFVPFSRSRNAKEGSAFGESLNWKVTLLRNGQPILTTDYSAGVGHCPASKNPPKFASGKVDKYLQRKRIADEIENGKVSKLTEHGSRFALGGEAILPDPTDVIYSMVQDYDVLNYRDFADWAESVGYNADSISDKAIYDQCMSIALNINAALPADEAQKLRDAAMDY